MDLDPKFAPILESYDLDRLESHHGAVYGLWPDSRLAYVNPGWHRFAAENRGVRIAQEWGLGAVTLDAYPKPLRTFFADTYRRCLESRAPWFQEYLCPSPDLYRRFHQIVYPLPDGEGLLIVNSLVAEDLHSPDENGPADWDARQYRDANGLVRQCCHCRRVMHASTPGRWDWIREWVEEIPANSVDTLCPTCLGHYYSELS